MQEELGSPRTGEALLLDAALQAIPFGFCVWSPDFSLVLWNQHYLDIYGFPGTAIRRGMSLYELVALSCKLGNHPDTSVEDFYEAYTAELLSNRSGARMVNLELTAAQRTLETAHIYAPGLGWVVTHEDVTDELARSDMMAERKHELERQYALLDAAINNMSQGLSMFDAKCRLVACNRVYAQMYGLPEELTRPETEFAAILDHRLASNRHAPVDREQYFRERMAILTGGKYVREVVKMTDGTYLSLRHQPLDGGGVVTTHEDITEQLAAEARMRHIATHDALTDLPNRALFREHLEATCQNTEAGRHFALLAINLDNFRAINDSNGHAMGDHVLRTIAQRLVDLAGSKGRVARLGGDEFGIILTGLKDPRQAADTASAIVASVAEPIIDGILRQQVTASVGIAVGPADGHSADTMMNNADLALARAKSEGRSTYHFFEAGMDAALQRRRAIETGLRAALETDALELVFQPLVGLDCNKIVAAEALLRWTHPEFGPISPVEFIPIAEESGLIRPIGVRVLEKAAKAAANWPAEIAVAVNLSSVQFARGDLVAQVAEALKCSGLESWRLELEITESLLLEDSAANLDTLHKLRDLGIRIAMDDFGTGYSALSYLRAFPFDKIKIDRAFMSDIATKSDSRAIVKAMIGLGTSLGMTTVAEGVETIEQLEVIRAEGCAQVQGYYFSPPVSAEAFAQMVASETIKAEKTAC
ncbi:putative bifunctional diguanylate cyclase/phosphodiesterase [Pelagibacterium lentulum]|uniref:Uncharacterized protein n=1 Tax=Pelagibacterium lentulum TaxID=2029865 RepID=A0A916R5F9_9HYPH|nr:EAL domain-containing protein [Pelagibacterium lentulum]GGA36836.1 hypothetical protein GCM10011499_02700 [Pelagibacterium lentulum]